MYERMLLVYIKINICTSCCLLCFWRLWEVWDIKHVRLYPNHAGNFKPPFNYYLLCDRKCCPEFASEDLSILAVSFHTSDGILSFFSNAHKAYSARNFQNGVGDRLQNTSRGKKDGEKCLKYFLLHCGNKFFNQLGNPIF